MFSMDIKDIVNHMVEHMLMRNDKIEKDKALYFNFDLEMCVCTKEFVFHQSKGLHLLYQRNSESRVITVFSGVTENHFDNLDKVSEWKHESSHDTCWRNDVKVFNDLYFSMAEQINNELMNKGLEEVAPGHMSQFVHMRNSLPKWVMIDIDRDISNKNKPVLKYVEKW